MFFLSHVHLCQCSFSDKHILRTTAPHVLCYALCLTNCSKDHRRLKQLWRKPPISMRPKCNGKAGDSLRRKVMVISAASGQHSAQTSRGVVMDGRCCIIWAGATSPALGKPSASESHPEAHRPEAGSACGCIPLSGCLAEFSCSRIGVKHTAAPSQQPAFRPTSLSVKKIPSEQDLSPSICKAASRCSRLALRQCSTTHPFPEI